MKRIENPALEWNNEQPSSAAFQDIYYSRKNGLTETSLVFLHGNHLPQRWMNEKQFTIFETGFGTGLNFLATWRLFSETAPLSHRLDFISVERYPLHLSDLQRALKPWRTELGDTYVDRLLAVYPIRSAGFHRLWITDHVTLTLIFDSAERALKQLDCVIDAWFLDGFAPSRNTDLWQEPLFKEMARLSVNGTTLASFTNAKHVRTDLEKSGFSITRHDGFSYKKHRICGVYHSDKTKKPFSSIGHVTLIGAGIAGVSMALALQRRGVSCSFIEKSSAVAQGASSNLLGLINPKIEAQDNPRTDIGLSAYSFAHHILSSESFNDLYKQTGSIHLSHKEEKQNKFAKIQEYGFFLDSHFESLSAQYATDLSGLKIDQEAVLFPAAATLEIEKFVRRVAKDFQTSLENKWHGKESNEITILCSGWGLSEFPSIKQISMQAVRGQVLYVDKKPEMHLRCPILFGHYIAPVNDQTWVMGATFDRNDTRTDPSPDDDQRITSEIYKFLDLNDFTIQSRWAQIRTTTPDRFPFVGSVPDHQNLYLLGGLGSHGIQFGLLLGEILACQLTNAPLPIGKDALEKVTSHRFWKKS